MKSESYKVLYRKYRPSNFSEVVGQSSIIETLKLSVENHTFSHAYVFTGPRGTGKTSTAKIMAKALNCENPIDGEPCGKCRCCQNFSTSPDIIEIDAASNNGVDEIRELRNNVVLAPGMSKYKIYIIDEVHMLSAGAFNALLKTLEEPPSHAIFILATTEVYKIPITIMSRCQRYDFKKIPKNTMISYLEDICAKEKIKCDSEIYSEIYELSDGCLRDALSILDQLTKCNDKISLELLSEKYSLASDAKIKEMLNKINERKPQDIVNIVDNFEENGINPQKLIQRIIKILEQIAVEIKTKMNSEFKFNKILKLTVDLNQIYIDARINDNIYPLIKLVLLNSIDAEGEQVKKSDTSKDVKMDATSIRINNCFVEANKKSLENIRELWNNIAPDSVKEIDMGDYKPVAASEKYAIFVSDDESLANLFNIKNKLIEKILKKEKTPVKVVSITEKRWNSEKIKYMEKKKSGIEYKYIEEKDNKDNENLEVNTIFDNNIIEIS